MYAEDGDDVGGAWAYAEEGDDVGGAWACVYAEGEVEGPDPGGCAYDVVGEFVERFANVVEGEVDGFAFP